MGGKRMHHGWILAGKSGLGKSDFALAAARELVSEEGIRQPMAHHPDIIVLSYGPKDKAALQAQMDGKPFELARSIRINQIRGMQRRLTTRPTLGNRRVVIINPADEMETGASNALLKSLEEPPQGTFFVLVTHRPARLLPTIRSRCRILRFPLLSGTQLAKMLSASGTAADDDAQSAALRAAEGSYGAALRFVQQDLGAVALIIRKLLSSGDPGFVIRAELSRMVGPRADRDRLQAVLELAQALVAETARNTEISTNRAKLIQAHSDLVLLTAQAPSFNFDTGLLLLEIGSLLVRAAPASERAHV
jgi:DNA polymerase-3 subunit delta'